jgi:mercuric ion transport protein
MQTATKQLWASALAGVVGSLCCVAPLVFITIGISGAWISQLTALEPYRPIFIGVMLVFICLAFRQLYIVPAQSEGGACLVRVILDNTKILVISYANENNRGH